MAHHVARSAERYESRRSDSVRFQRYGSCGAAMTANVITYRGRSAVRDVGKVLAFEGEQLARLATAMPQFEYKMSRTRWRSDFPTPA